MDYVQIGKIINTHGICGEVKILPLTDNVKRFEKLYRVYLGKNKEVIHIERLWYKNDFVILKFKEFNNINEVLSFKDNYLYIDEEDVVDLPEDTYFVFDVIGCEVFNLENRRIGLISEVLETGSNDVYVVKDDNGREYLIPAVKEFIKKIDVENKIILIEPIEGMID